MTRSSGQATGGKASRQTSVPGGRKPAGRSVLCLGEALVDMVCERPVAHLAEADAFVPSFGGVAANVAVNAARHGAPVALAGGAGEDPWGRWLRDRLRDEGIDTRWFALGEGARTRLVFAAVDEAGEPSYDLYGDDPRALLRALGGGETASGPDPAAAALAACDGIFLTTNVLVDPDERELALSLRERALSDGKAVVFDPNIRMHRWQLRSQAQSYANACVRDALLVCATLEDAQLMTGESDAEMAARALLKGGARMVVLTLGARGAMLRGELRLDAPGVAARVRSTIGAGDALTGVLLARLALSGWYPAAAAAALPDAVAEAARATERWGALA